MPFIKLMVYVCVCVPSERWIKAIWLWLFFMLFALICSHFFACGILFFSSSSFGVASHLSQFVRITSSHFFVCQMISHYYGTHQHSSHSLTSSSSFHFIHFFSHRLMKDHNEISIWLSLLEFGEMLLKFSRKINTFAHSQMMKWINKMTGEAAMWNTHSERKKDDSSAIPRLKFGEKKKWRRKEKRKTRKKMLNGNKNMPVISFIFFGLP